MLLSLIPGSFIAGVLMFLAPCTLPIVPGYLVFIAGTPASNTVVGGRVRRRRILYNAAAFVVGFSIIFISLGLFASAIGSVFGIYREYISRIAGAVIILFGLMMLNIVRLPVVGDEWHAKIPKFLSLGRWESSLLIGALFAFGWSPCIGPILGTVLLFASNSATLAQGAILLGVFSLGLGIPFILTALLIDTAGDLFIKWGRVLNVFSTMGGILLICMGSLILFGMMGVLVEWYYRIFDLLGYSRLYNYL